MGLNASSCAPTQISNAGEGGTQSRGGRGAEGLVRDGALGIGSNANTVSGGGGGGGYYGQYYFYLLA